MNEVRHSLEHAVRCRRCDQSTLVVVQVYDGVNVSDAVCERCHCAKLMAAPVRRGVGKRERAARKRRQVDVVRDGRLT